MEEFCKVIYTKIEEVDDENAYIKEAFSHF
jgi:hypothetical protein